MTAGAARPLGEARGRCYDPGMGETALYSDLVTDGIRVGAVAFFLPEQSDPAERRFVFAYRILIENTGDRTATLRARHWDIVDAEGRREEVDGPGVVGEFPRLAPGQAFRYHSFAVLKTAWGTMQGHYTFAREDGTHFEARIGRFYLVPQRGE